MGVPGRQLSLSVETMTSHCPDQLWSVRTATVPPVAARTDVPHAAEKSSPV